MARNTNIRLAADRRKSPRTLQSTRKGIEPVSALPPITPDGRYLVVRDRLWRTSNPDLTPEVRTLLVAQLMDARREVSAALKVTDPKRLTAARAAVHAAKISLGERGRPWWIDGSKDFNRYLVNNSPYADWYRELQSSA